MSKLSVTNFSNRSGSAFKTNQEVKLVHQEVLQKSHYEKQKEKQSELMQKVNKKTAEYQASKPSSGVFTEVVTAGAFNKNGDNSKKTIFNDKPAKSESPPPPKVVKSANGSKSLLGFPSSANDLALDAKTDLESDPNISKEVKKKVIEKLFTLVSMVQHVYESKVRIMTEFEKFKDTHLKNESRREREHSEQLYKLNMNFQNEVVQAIQRLKSELDITRNASLGSNNDNNQVDFNTSDNNQPDLDVKQGDDVITASEDAEQIEINSDDVNCAADNSSTISC